MTERVPHVDLEELLLEVNSLLAGRALPVAVKLEPLGRDSANPVVVASAGERRYVVKVSQRHPGSLQTQMLVANALREAPGLPVPLHICHSRPADRFPLMVMEWLPGEPLLSFFRSPDNQACAEDVAHSWGESIARFHSACLPARVQALVRERSFGGFREWLRSRIGAALQALEAVPGWPPEDTTALRSYADARFQRLRVPARPGLVKADQDFRDALAVDRPVPIVSAMLDWERVEAGDTLWEIGWLRARMALLGLERLWTPFREGYESVAPPLEDANPILELYVLARTLIAIGTHEEAPAIAWRLVQGASALGPLRADD